MTELTDALRTEICSYASWLAEDVEDLEKKPYLMRALASHTARHLGMQTAEVLPIIRAEWGVAIPDCKHAVECIMQSDIDNRTGFWTCLQCGNRRQKL